MSWHWNTWHGMTRISTPLHRIYWYKPMSWGDLFQKFHYILVTIGPKIVFTQKTQTWLIHFNRIPSATEKHLMVFLTYCTSITLKVTGSCGCFVWEFWFMQSHISQCGATETHYKTMQFKVWPWTCVCGAFKKGRFRNRP